MGRYSSRSEVIRAAIRELLKRELWESEHGLEKSKKKNARSKVIEVLKEI